MAGEIQITVIGNLTADPEMRYTQNGLAVVNLTIASTPKVFDKQANAMKDGDPVFMRGSAWREFAEHIAGSLTKGTRVIASGVLKQRQYETKEGEKRSSMELQIDSIGPDLRWATASVTRAQSGGRGAPAAQGNDEPWPATAPAASAPPAAGGQDVWNAPGNFSDETPF